MGSKTRAATATGKRQSLTGDNDPLGDVKELITEMNKTLIVEMNKTLSDKLDSVESKLENNSKVISELTGQIKELFGKNKEMEKAVKELNIKVNNQEDNISKLTSESRDLKRIQERNDKERRELLKTQEDLADQLALIEMRQKELILRLRGVPERQGERIEEKLFKELANWLGVKEEDLMMDVDKIYRIRGDRSKKFKGPGDCLIFLNSGLLKDKILQRKKQEPLVIEGKSIAIFKEVPKRFRVKRLKYKRLTDALSAKGIWYVWEFPEGLTFTFKERRKTIKSIEDAENFLERSGKELLGGGEEAEENETEIGH
ncbi:uncharacterized protein LOC118084639 [Zootoca vivipara]|uniref:uncharacterized protein LOC118084639 n=1 Tax=Zootoca vivipara TaxID=8524 RepID=UPI00293BE55B|nr:uncharacterized protein LOC118084639 [Zootoca vivipara]XP_060129615.1 uncharacterized protein LOC118084639 [Zootoca vivipara]XP_060129616.1 uncharacterized protein LOC118084639 [Zootoca vivipara]XP_060129617.1 uncharacterized protein LOC118084639 [Zootoca vivipara]XP_060129618.1 uncharacterized protein LOC118084639 [Zootoca vivipara]XP_060129619.1 uncharacterized protein LOC118084639 [Zootoca vivipara]XP_060129620.1 uncharacterized protein LOC118084639 [Zootoca vivipara]XP_060129621.1 unc